MGQNIEGIICYPVYVSNLTLNHVIVYKVSNRLFDTITKTLFLKFFGLVAFVEQKENDNKDNLLKIQVGRYNASALIKHCKDQHGFNVDCNCYRFIFAR